MSLSVAIQMDPIEPIDIDADSTFALALEAQARGHTLHHYLPWHLTYDVAAGTARVRARALQVRRQKGNHASLGRFETLDLGAVDIVLMRQDPPFDMSYIAATHMLEAIHPRTLVVNDPAAVRNAPEKILVTRFPELMPPTLITSDLEEIRAFWRAHSDIIVKPLFGNGGAGVFHLRPGDENLTSLIEVFQSISREPLMVQRYQAEVRAGDRRVILIDGEPVGAVNRVPQEGEARSNMHIGGRPEKIGLNQRDREICAAIGPLLRQQGLLFVGIDVIGDYLTEINVTSPTGIQETGRFDGTDLAAPIWDAIERRFAETRA